MTAIWKEKSFNQLTLDEMYQLLSLRTAVFVVEQNCPYQELDGKDQVAKHLWLENENGQLMALSEGADFRMKILTRRKVTIQKG